MMDNAESRELHLTATIEGKQSLDEHELQDKVEEMLKRIARETGFKVCDIHLMRVGEVEPGTIEAEADWLSE